MKYNGPNKETGAQRVLPARDAERSIDNLQETAMGNNKRLSLAPIGVFDSGVGGLTILTTLRKTLPYEDYIYIGDTAHVPYGARSEEEISDLALKACGFLIEQGVKLIVVACNTASQAALNALRSTYPI